MITNNLSRETVLRIDVGDIFLCPSLRRQLCLSRYCNNFFTEPVDDDKNCVVTLRLREGSNHVDGDHLPRTVWNHIQLEGGSVFSMSDFGSLACLTTLGVTLYISLDPRPPIVTCNEFLCLVTTRVSSRDAVVVESNDLFTESSATWYIEAVFPGDKFSIVVPILFFISEGFDDGGILGVMMVFDLRYNVLVESFDIETGCSEVGEPKSKQGTSGDLEYCLCAEAERVAEILSLSPPPRSLVSYRRFLSLSIAFIYILSPRHSFNYAQRQNHTFNLRKLSLQSRKQHAS